MQSGHCRDHEGTMYQSTGTVPNVNVLQRYLSLVAPLNILHVRRLTMNIDIESRLHGNFAVLADMLELCKRTL